MNCNVNKATIPTMPNFNKGTECIKILLSQTSKEMHAPLLTRQDFVFAPSTNPFKRKFTNHSTIK